MRQEGALEVQRSLSRQTLRQKEVLRSLLFHSFTSLDSQNGAEK